MAGLFDEIKGMVQGFPQTQKDIRQIAQTTRDVRSPEMQQMVTDIREELQSFAHVQLALQALSTAAIVGMFIINLKNSKGGF